MATDAHSVINLHPCKALPQVIVGTTVAGVVAVVIVVVVVVVVVVTKSLKK